MDIGMTQEVGSPLRSGYDMRVIIIAMRDIADLGSGFNVLLLFYGEAVRLIAKRREPRIEVMQFCLHDRNTLFT